MPLGRRTLLPQALPKAVPLAEREATYGTLSTLWNAYRMRWTRRRLLARAIAARSHLRPVADRSTAITPGMVLCFVTLRNEATRLPFFLDHHRRLGVGHFLIVDNASTDASAALLKDLPDVSLWHSAHSYKAARFGLDWITWLQFRHGHGHWCLTLDVDETLIYPHWPERDLAALIGWLEARGQRSLGTLMLDLYPKGPLGAQSYTPGTDPADILRWFDPGPWRRQYQPRSRSLWVQGGVRARVFFAQEPDRAPTMNKTPLVKWNRRYAYINSTHALLPPVLNPGVDDDAVTGVLLHSKFLPEILPKSAEERQRREHFANSTLYDSYYDRLVTGPDLWSPESLEYRDWQQLKDLGLMSQGTWR